MNRPAANLPPIYLLRGRRVVRAFVRMREELATSATIMKRLAEIDKKLLTHDTKLRDVYARLRPLLLPLPEPPRKEMGYHTTLKKP